MAARTEFAERFVAYDTKPTRVALKALLEDLDEVDDDEATDSDSDGSGSDRPGDDAAEPEAFE